MWGDAAADSPHGEDVNDRCPTPLAEVGARCNHGCLVWGRLFCYNWVPDSMARPLLEKELQGMQVIVHCVY